MGEGSERKKAEFWQGKKAILRNSQIKQERKWEKGTRRGKCERVLCRERKTHRGRTSGRAWWRSSAVEPAVSTPSGYLNKLVQAKRENLLG